MIHGFTFILSPPPMDETAAADKLYGSGCDDALFSVVGGTCFLDFDREAETLEEAIRTAREDVERSALGLLVEQVILEEPS